MVEKELKFRVENVKDLIEKLNNKGISPFVCYIRDEIYGSGIDMKIMRPKFRKRIKIYSDTPGQKFTAIRKTIPREGKIKTIIEEEVSEIPAGNKLEVSYEKIRWEYNRFGGKILVDFYSFGVYCEIEGESENNLETIAKSLGFEMKDNIKENIDQIYTKWCKKNKRKLRSDWGFGKI